MNKVLCAPTAPYVHSPRLHPFGCEYAYVPGWNWLERLYIRIFGFVDLPSRLRARLVMQQLRRMEWKRLLDLGCGTGCYSLFFSRRQDAEVYGIDVDSSRIQDCLAAAETLGRSNVHFIASSIDLGLLSFETGEIDLVLAIEILQYMPDLALTLKEIRRVLKPGGFLVAHCPVLGSLRCFENVLLEDQAIRVFLHDAGFQINGIYPTFGGVTKALCRAYECISRNELLTAMLFPLLLLGSLPWRNSGNGAYRLLVAQKPFGADN